MKKNANTSKISNNERYGVGIDTGGTYTDAVIYDFNNNRIIDSAKSLTTRQDLSVGITNALDKLNPSYVQAAKTVSLSTTLATNACVEEKGGRAKLIFIGIEEKIIRMVGNESGLNDESVIYYLPAETTIMGEIISHPDWGAFKKDITGWISDAEAIAVVELNASNNGAVLEKKAKEIITENHNLPVICGYELFSGLDSVKRGAGALLNGRLIPVLTEFLYAVKNALSVRNINVPVSIVRSDGSHMSEHFTCARPVETVLCGPAAGVIGGSTLTNYSNAVIVDMGGTTTDISLVREGRPVMSREGINIGRWKTYVEGLYVETLGLGGDSGIRYDKSFTLYQDTKRLIPLAVLSKKWPHVISDLEKLNNEKAGHSVLLHEFFVAIKDIDNNPAYTEEERRFCSILSKKPLIYSDAAAAAGKDIYSFRFERLEAEGVIIRSGLTPTDIMHIKGDFNEFDTSASLLGAHFVAASLKCSVETLCANVYDMIKKKLFHSIVGMLLKNEKILKNKYNPEGDMDTLINYAWVSAKFNKEDTSRSIRLNFTTTSVLIGVGAPIHIFLPDVAKVLSTRCIIPKYADVMNAAGAAAGNTTATSVTHIRPFEQGKYLVYGTSINTAYDSYEEALSAGKIAAECESREELIRRGAVGRISTDFSIEPITAKTGYGGTLFVECNIFATSSSHSKLKKN